MKKTITIITLLLTTYGFSQDIKTESETEKTKMETFASKTGVITKFTDNNLSNLKSTHTVAETRVRKVNSGGSEQFFYQIEKPDKYGTTTASIEYSDLLEVIKAFNSLKSEVESDLSKNPDYLENKFITEDGFQLGYYVSKGKATWYMKLEKYGSDKTLFINDLEKIETNFIEAKNKIEELKK
ncbi:MAG: hypothetical protein Q8O62_07405 [Aequorivita sp.]|nr:hypothetical protein [Aequorivita sp.]